MEFVIVIIFYMNTYLTYIHKFEFVFMLYVWCEAQITLTSPSNRIAVPKSYKCFIIVTLDAFAVLTLIIVNRNTESFVTVPVWISFRLTLTANHTISF